MKIYIDNIDVNSRSGPNTFAVKLARSLLTKNHRINLDDKPEVQLSFIHAQKHLAPIVQRLDGIYFNSQQDWKTLNKPIKDTFDIASGVIYQSSFNKTLTEKYFGKKASSVVIHNGTDLDAISGAEVIQNQQLDKFEDVWTCASSWRPHKRLSENVRDFLEHSSEKDCLVIAGENADFEIKHDRVFYAGNLNWPQLIGLYKRSKYFIHLALMDHCPNVVVDARAAGCKIICSDSGGTKEIAGLDSIVIKDVEWDFEPFKLYEPPKLDFTIAAKSVDPAELDINKVSEEYVAFLEQHKVS